MAASRLALNVDALSPVSEVVAIHRQGALVAQSQLREVRELGNGAACKGSRESRKAHLGVSLKEANDPLGPRRLPPLQTVGLVGNDQHGAILVSGGEPFEQIRIVGFRERGVGVNADVFGKVEMLSHFLTHRMKLFDGAGRGQDYGQLRSEYRSGKEGDEGFAVTHSDGCDEPPMLRQFFECRCLDWPKLPGSPRSAQLFGEALCQLGPALMLKRAHGEVNYALALSERDRLALRNELLSDGVDRRL